MNWSETPLGRSLAVGALGEPWEVLGGSWGGPGKVLGGAPGRAWGGPGEILGIQRRARGGLGRSEVVLGTDLADGNVKISLVLTVFSKRGVF